MKKLNSYIVLFFLLAALIPAAMPEPVQAQGELLTEEIQPDGSSGYDSYISEDSETSNFGTSEYMIVGNDTDTTRGLIAWDFSTLPTDAGVLSATLSIWVAEDHAANASTLEAYAVRVPWDEGYVTYEDTTDTDTWTTYGAEDTEYDILPDPSGAEQLTASLTPGTRVDIVLNPDIVGNMIRANYYGFLLRTDTEADDAYTFYTSDYVTDATKRPLLTLEYDPSPDMVDAIWVCIPGDASCVSEMPMSPFSFTNEWSNASVRTDYAGASEGPTTMFGINMNCEPYPLCKNDYPIYYRIYFDMIRQSQNTISWSIGTVTLTMPGGPNVVQRNVNCGNQQRESCFGWIQGVMQPSEIVSTSQDIDFGMKFHMAVPAEWPTYTVANWIVMLSRQPFSQECADTYMVPTIDTYTIDPTIETPAGMVGDTTPEDEQGYPTIPGAIYMVRVQDGPWNDSAADRYDTAVSTNGTDYVSFESFVLDERVLCYEVDPLNQYRITVYFTADTETFFIKVNDGAGLFADNTNDEEEPITYSIGVSFLIAQAVDCASQFTYDEVADNIASVTVPSTDDDVYVNSPLMAQQIEAGEWYGIEVANGSWHENIPITSRIDMEFKFTIPGAPVGHNTEIVDNISEWADLATGSDLVFCVSDDASMIYIQAPEQEGMTLHLRVNDQDTPYTFGDNTGTLGVNIFHATFTRTVTGCELQFNIGSLVDSDTVDAGAVNGQAFGNWYRDAFLYDMTPSYHMTSGGWYVLETTGGPWRSASNQGIYTAGNPYYDIELDWPLIDDDSWVYPADWPITECAVEIDALGHQRVYFQVPNNNLDDLNAGGGEFNIRAAGAGMLSSGEIGWELYESINISPPGGTIDGCEDFIYDPEVATGIGEIDSRHEDGDYIIGLEVNTYRAVQIESANTASDPPYYDLSGWFEQSGGDEIDDLQLTIDGGNTWAALPNHPAVLCYYYTPVDNELVFIFQVLNGQEWRMRADSETFTDNTGIEIYRTYAVTAGDNLDPWTSCADDYTATVPAINEHEWIPPQDEEGINLMPTLTYTPGNDPDGNGIIFWGDPGLQAGHDYMVETMNGPWEDGESPTSRYDAELSSDGGASWHSFGEHPDVICYVEDQLGWYSKAIFHVDTGQIWKIRVADSESETFTDNSGSLAYGLHLVNEFPVDGPGDYVTDYDPGAFDVCTQSILRPASLTLAEIGSLGNYFGDWIHYINRSLLSYFAWCPRHTALLMSAVNALKTKEPLATIAEMDTISKTVVADVDSYDWEGGGFEDTSIFAANTTGKVNSLADRFIPASGEAFDVWNGGELVVFGDTTLPAYFTTCNNVFAEYLPSRLKTGVCFASAYWKDTGASFWLQLIFDILSIFVLIGMVKGAAQSLVYMMTGVRPWTKDGGIKVIETVARGDDLVQPVENWRRR